MCPTGNGGQTHVRAGIVAPHGFWGTNTTTSTQSDAEQILEARKYQSAVVAPSPWARKQNAKLNTLPPHSYAFSYGYKGN